MITAIAAGAQALGSIAGGILGASAARKAKQARLNYIKQAQQENQNWYDRRYNEDATQRADAQRLLQITEDNIRKRNKAVAGREAIMGGGTEETAREKERNNEVMGNVVGQIEAQNELRKDKIEDQYLNRKQALGEQAAEVEAGYQQAKAENIASAIQGVTGAAGNIAGAFAKTPTK